MYSTPHLDKVTRLTLFEALDGGFQAYFESSSPNLPVSCRVSDYAPRGFQKVALWSNLYNGGCYIYWNGTFDKRSAVFQITDVRDGFGLNLHTTPRAAAAAGILDMPVEQSISAGDVRCLRPLLPGQTITLRFGMKSHPSSIVEFAFKFKVVVSNSIGATQAGLNQSSHSRRYADVAPRRYADHQMSMQSGHYEDVPWSPPSGVNSTNAPALSFDPRYAGLP